MKDTDWQIIYELRRNPNITKVAGILFKTQSAITKRLQAIEEELGVLVVERTPTGIVFTQAGEYLAERAEEYIAFERETKEGLERILRKEQPIIHLGSSYTFSKYNFASSMKKFIDSHKSLRYTVLNKQSDILHAMVMGGKLDAAFVQGDYINGVNHVLVSLSQGYLMTTREVSEEDLPKMDRVGYQTSGHTTNLLRDWWKSRFNTEFPPSVVEAGYVDFALRQLLAGENRYLICFLPKNWVNSEQLFVKNLVKNDGCPFERPTWFIYGTEKRRSMILDELISYVEKNLAIAKL